ncbi:MAG: asparagine synthase (glutamine-hydrolyzing) [Chthoniobacterales bacterium]|nr:asparagine synthase (glutamine-hydrolyzing) [Chthoniobacterales bacterium]
MCGIAGVLVTGERLAVEAGRSLVEAMMERMRHRGPDARGVHSCRSVILGNVRLAIQGIDVAGNQPLYNEDRSIGVVFNGEIYNHHELRRELEKRGHVFRSQSDTEVLVHLYEECGANFAQELNGMFAFALHDMANGRIVVGRDRTAQKPFFLHRNSSGIFFASELRALLLAVKSPRINPIALRDFLSLGYYLEPDNLIEGVESLGAGEVRVYTEKGDIVLRKQLAMPTLAPDEECLQDMETWIAEAEGVFRRAVARHTISDVPVAVFLSGGVDSSLVAAFLAETGGVQAAFTGSFSDEPDFDEFRFSQELGRRLGVELNRVDLSKRSLAGAIEDFCEKSSQPQGDYSGLPSFVLARETARSYKVVLGGDGGDELFLGYPTFLLPRLQQLFGKIIPHWAIEFAAAICRLGGKPTNYLPLRFRLSLLGQAWKREAASAHYAIKDFLPPSIAGLILDKEFFGKLVHEIPGMKKFRELFWKNGEIPNQCPADAERRLGRLDFQTYLASCTIPKMERNCMAWSLENRLPLLDLEVLALASRTPVSLLLSNGKGKQCLRQLLQKKMSRLTINPRKQGFGPPLAAMLKNELHDWVHETLKRKHPAFLPNFAEVLNEWQKAGWDLHRLVWNVCIFLDWTARNGVE